MRKKKQKKARGCKASKQGKIRTHQHHTLFFFSLADVIRHTPTSASAAAAAAAAAAMAATAAGAQSSRESAERERERRKGGGGGRKKEREKKTSTPVERRRLRRHPTVFSSSSSSFSAVWKCDENILSVCFFLLDVWVLSCRNRSDRIYKKVY